MQKLPLLFFLAASLHFAHAQSDKQPVLVTDMLKIRTPSGVAITKDGRRAAFTVTSIIPDEANKLDYKYQSQIFMVETSGNDTPIQLTTSKEGASQPAWSPDGSRLAFVRSVNGKPQIFLLSMAGGEATQLTKSAYGATDPKWSPDGSKILFASDITLEDLLKDSVLNSGALRPGWPAEKPGYDENEQWNVNGATPDPNGNLAQINAYLSRNAADKKAIVLNKLDFQDEASISDALACTQFFTIDATGNADPSLVTRIFSYYTTADFLPDGRHIIVSGDVDSLELPDRSLEMQIFVTELDGSHERLLLGENGKRYTAAAASPSGKWLAFLQSTTDIPIVSQLSVMPMSGSPADIITIPFDRSINNITWSADEKYLYFTAPSNGGFPLHRMALKSQKVEVLSDFDIGISDFAMSADKIVFVKNQVSNPSEVYVSDAALKSEKKLSNFNDWVKTKKLSFPEKKVFTNEAGLQIEYWIMKPVDFREGEKYPVLLEIHGGPGAMWGPGEASMWHEFQYFCGKGYGVVYSNPRGSGGYGAAFMKSNMKDWGAGPASDVLAALDHAVSNDWADTSKLLITGGSYAGYLTAWIIAHDKRFKAACSQRGVYDLATFFGEGNAWRLVPAFFGGYPWEPEVKKLLISESPITYVDNITTPYIIFHGANDRRTGFVQSEMMYRSLKVLKRPVEYVVHPNATHEITRAGDNRQRIDQMLRTYEFFERWLRRDPDSEKGESAN